MGIDSRIPLLGQVVDPVGAFSRGRGLALQQEGQQTQNKLAQLKLQAAEQSLGQQNQLKALIPGMVKGDQSAYTQAMQIDPKQAAQIQSSIQGMNEAQRKQVQDLTDRTGALLAGYSALDEGTRAQSWPQVRQQLLGMGIDDAPETPNQLWINQQLAEAGAMKEILKGSGSNIGTYNPRDYTPQSFAEFARTKDPAVLQRYEAPQQVKVAGVPYTYDRTNATLTPLQTAGQVAQTEALITGSKESAKMQAKLQTEPAVQAAVTSAVEQAKAVSEEAGEERSNERALLVYQTGMQKLSESLLGTSTGSFVGLLPAITENQRIAEGAVAAMAPILKQIFRVAGEGDFTDKDQQMLIDMLPTRKDAPAVIAAKLNTIDAVVNAKLGGAPQAAAQPKAEEPDIQSLVDKYANP